MADLWVQHFEGDTAETVQSLQDAFGVSEGTARGIVESAPCIVKRNVDPVKAMPWVKALREMGARVELRDEKFRMDPKASLKMPRAKFGRKSLRPSSPPPRVEDADAGVIRNPLGDREIENDEESVDEDDPGRISEAAAAIEAILAPDDDDEPNAEPPRSDAANAEPPNAPKAAPPKAAPPKAAPNVAPPKVAPPTAKPAEADPIESAAASLLSPIDDTGLFADPDADEGPAELDVSGSLDIEPDEPPPAPPLRTSGAPAPSAAPNAAQDGFGFGEDPLEPPLPEGGLELDIVEPPPSKRPAPRSSMPAGRVSTPGESLPPRTSHAPEPAASDRPPPIHRQLKEQSSNGWGGVVAGGILLGVRVAFGSSCFLGTSSIWQLAFDAIGLAAVSMGLLQVVASYQRSVLEPRFYHHGLLAVAMFGVAFGLNLAFTPSDDVLFVMEIENEDEDHEEAIRDGQYMEGRTWAQSQGADASTVTNLIEELYTAGATKVWVNTPNLIVEAPSLPAARAGIERAYRRFLGFRRDEVESNLHPARRYWKILVVF